MDIKKVVVIGSGTMGSGIAAHLCNANVPVTLLDLTTEISEKARDRIHKSRPPLLLDKTKIENIKVGNIKDNFDVVNNVFSPDKVIYYNSLIQHIDRKSIDDDISKVFIDNYILSQKTVDLYITFNSNYGRIAALSCLHDNIYDINCSELDKKNLLSKSKLYI